MNGFSARGCWKIPTPVFCWPLHWGPAHTCAQDGSMHTLAPKMEVCTLEFLVVSLRIAILWEMLRNIATCVITFCDERNFLEVLNSANVITNVASDVSIRILSSSPYPCQPRRRNLETKASFRSLIHGSSCEIFAADCDHLLHLLVVV